MELKLLLQFFMGTTLFLHNYGVPFAQLTASDLMCFRVPKLVKVFGGRKCFTTAVKCGTQRV